MHKPFIDVLCCSDGKIGLCKDSLAFVLTFAQNSV